MSADTPNNDIFQVDKKMLRADAVEIKDIATLGEYLRNESELTEEEIDSYLDHVKKVADTINKKVSEREVTVKNLYISDDDLLKQYVDFAEAEINKDKANLGKEANKGLLALMGKIKKGNGSHIERRYVMN